jgi:hypothetical protein
MPAAMFSQVLSGAVIVSPEASHGGQSTPFPRSPVCGSGAVVCSLFLLIRWAQRARCQAETPLIVSFRFLRPALLSAAVIAMLGLVAWLLRHGELPGAVAHPCSSQFSVTPVCITVFAHSRLIVR